MAKFKLTTAHDFFIPPVDLVLEDGKTVNNRDLEEADQIKLRVRLANQAEINEYLCFYTVQSSKRNSEIKQKADYQYGKCIRKHVEDIKGLEDFGIANGQDLMAHEPCKEFNAIIQHAFNYIIGVEDIDEKK